MIRPCSHAVGRATLGSCLLLATLAAASCDRSRGQGEPSQPAVAVVAAAKPTRPLPPGSSCVTAACHASYATARRIHGPVAFNACDACHGADTGTHAFPLRRPGAATCTFCHSVAGTEKHQHAALEQGCTVCHDPHISNEKYLLKATSVNSLCANCHETVMRAFAHEPFAQGACTVCHRPHQADNPFLLRGGEGQAHCYQCHDAVRHTVAEAGHVHEPVAQCTHCHSPHSSDFAGNLKQPQEQLCLTCHESVKMELASVSVTHGAMHRDRQCANCHEPHGSSSPKLLRGREDVVCLTCHAEAVAGKNGEVVPAMKSVLGKSRFLHGPARTGDCSACHKAHGGKEAALVVTAYPDGFYSRFDVRDYALCFTCHEQELVLTASTRSLTNFRNGDVNLHYVHVNRDPKGRTCRTCHNVHGSDLPNHMAASVPFEDSSWAMPIGYEKLPDGGSCAPGCHKPSVYSRDADNGDAP